MNAQILNMISIVAFIVAAVFILLSVILFFRLHIKDVIDFLSGRAEARGIADMKNDGAKKRNKRRHQESDTSLSDRLGEDKTKVATVHLHASGHLENAGNTESTGNIGLTSRTAVEMARTAVAEVSAATTGRTDAPVTMETIQKNQDASKEGTTLLQESDGTTILAMKKASDATTILSPDGATPDGTTILHKEYEGPTTQGYAEKAEKAEKTKVEEKKISYRVIEEKTEIHTEEQL